jgi:hypothetical protein
MEKQIYSTDGDAAVWRLQVCGAMQYICYRVQSQLWMSEVFYSETWPHHSTVKTRSIQRRAGPFPEIGPETEKLVWILLGQTGNADQTLVFSDFAGIHSS